MESEIEKVRRELRAFARRHPEVAERCAVINGNLDILASRPDDVTLRQLIAARCNQAATFVPRDLDLTPGARCLGVATA